MQELNEKRTVDFFISELTNKDREGTIISRPSQLFGIFKLLKEKVPNIKLLIVHLHTSLD